MSFKGCMKNGKDDVIEIEGGPNDKRIKDSKTMELPHIDQGSKERINLLGLLKNMKWKNAELNGVEFPSTDEQKGSESQIVTRRAINRKIPETKPKVQINRPAPPQSPSKKFTKAQLEFSKRNPRKLSSLNISAKNANAKINGLNPQNQELIDTQNKIAKVQAQLGFLKNNPDYIPELDANDDKLSNTLNQIAKAQAELEFLENNPDYIPETNECIPRAPKKIEVITPKKNEAKVFKSNVNLIKSKENPKKTVTSSSKVLLKTKQVTKTPTAKQSKIASPLADIQKLREAETKTKLALTKNYTKMLLQTECKDLNMLAKQPDITRKIAEAKNNVAETKLQLEIFEESQEESFEDYRRRMQKCNRRREPKTLDTIIEEESEAFEDGCEEQEDVTEVEKLKVADKEECEEPDEEECDEAEEESQNVNEEEQEDKDNTESRTAISENENNNSHKFDTKIPAQQKRHLLDILKKFSWNIKEKSNESVELEEAQLAERFDNEEKSATECVKHGETQLVEVIESDSPKKHDRKIDDLEIQPLDTKKAESVSPKASKDDIFTSFFKNKSLHEEKMVSASEKSLLKFRKLQEELLESSSVATPKTEEVHTKSTSENESDKSRASEDGSFSSFFEEPKHKVENKPTKPVSDQPKSLSETKTESKKSKTTSIDLPRPNTIEFNLKSSNGGEIASKGLQRQPSLMKCKLEQDKRDEPISKGLKRQFSSIKCNMESDKKTVKLSTHKIINVAPYETASSMELEYSEDFESDSSDKLTKSNSQYTEVLDFTSDSCTKEEESLKIESVHMSEDSSKGSQQSFICHLYKVKIRIKSISWRDSGSMEAVTLSFYNPFTKENAAVQRRFVLPHFNTEDFYCCVPYISPPNILHSSLAYYSPVILINKRKSVAELARGVLNLNKGQTKVPLTKNGKIMGDIMSSVKVLDYGPLGDKDDSSNEIIEIFFKETESKEIKIEKTLQKKKKHLIVEEFTSSGDSTSSDLPPDRLFKKRPFRYKRKIKSERRYAREESFIAISSISIQTDKIEKQQLFINNCKDIQTDVQEEDVNRKKSKSKMIRKESEMNSKYITTTLQCESKVTQTEATSEQQTVSTPKNDHLTEYKMVETMKESPPAENKQSKRQQIISTDKNKLPNKYYEIVMTSTKLAQSSNTDETEENWKSEKTRKVSPELLKHQKLKQVRAEELYPESEEIKSTKLKQNKSSKNFGIGHQKSTNHKTEELDLTEKSSAEETPEAVHKHVQGKKRAEQFFKVCTVTPPSIKTKEKNSSEKRWISHMAAFLHQQKAMSSDGSSSAIDKTDDQVPEIHSEVAAPDVLINNPDYHAMKKYYHPELCKADVMTSTSCPYFRPPTNECGVQTCERVIKNFTAQTKQEKLLPLLSKKSKKLANKTCELQTCLMIVDTIPSAQNGGEKFINKNILYEKVCEFEKPLDGKTKDVKKLSKTVRLSKSNSQLDSYPGQCAGVMPNKNSVTNLQFELQDFVKNIKLELHILKHRANNTTDSNGQHRKSSTDFDRLVNSFTSLVARNEERDFNAVYSELQQLQDMVYKFKKFSEEHLGNTDFRSKTKQLKDVDNYVSQDKKLKLIYKNPKIDQAPERKSHDNNYYRQKPSRG